MAASSTDIQKRAEEKWREDRRDAFMGFVGSGLVTWAVWIAIAWGEWNVFPWPLIVNAFALMNLLRVATNRTEIVGSEVKRLERKQARASSPRRRSSPGRDPSSGRRCAPTRPGCSCSDSWLVVLAYPFLEGSTRAARCSASCR